MMKMMADRSVETKGKYHAVNQVSPLQLTAMLQKGKTTSTVMLDPLPDKLIKFTYFHVNTIGTIKAQRHVFVEHCCNIV